VEAELYRCPVPQNAQRVAVGDADDPARELFGLSQGRPAEDDQGEKAGLSRGFVMHGIRPFGRNPPGERTSCLIFRRPVTGRVLILSHICGFLPGGRQPHCAHT
jgi:hypothetical protein